ncbi:MAG: helix-turn-helix domain-containing protein [Gammaproteobacteria bacterium]|nr:helix-turn-helix domain-containing protein [Gammaproteobacteria bacterium]MBU1730488.1 helix-turn-helix domain-containing protein [Patescibacteria group bacterium]MBU1932174.1 helix-turn-helix domain-containing protein [Patescibacteria group bacterium]
MENSQENKLGKKIKSLRIKLELSQDKLARKADVPYTTLTKIETGVIRKPSVYVVAKIAKALNVSLDNLLKL